MFLAATGSRALEATSTRLCDYNFEKNNVFIRGEYTKTKKDRYAFITNELVEQIKSWITFKYRTRRISYTNPKRVEIRTPDRDDTDLLFASEFGEDANMNSLYSTLEDQFKKTLDRMGGKYAQYETSKKRRRKITFHSFRRHVLSTISDLGFGDFSEYFIGHSTSTYYRKPEKERYELFRKVEPYITYMDFSALERKGADIQSQLENMENENKELRKIMQAMKAKTDKLDQSIDNINKLKKKMGIKN